mmetsp:Transcript_43711/g.113963  ORF Transcript_43711/g.113963 Transcript_43711/m.113963 type:complete len:143 (+) Transcript_43711:2448-2876(+)
MGGSSRNRNLRFKRNLKGQPNLEMKEDNLEGQVTPMPSLLKMARALQLLLRHERKGLIVLSLPVCLPFRSDVAAAVDAKTACATKRPCLLSPRLHVACAHVLFCSSALLSWCAGVDYSFFSRYALHCLLLYLSLGVVIIHWC